MKTMTVRPSAGESIADHSLLTEFIASVERMQHELETAGAFEAVLAPELLSLAAGLEDEEAKALWDAVRTADRLVFVTPPDPLNDACGHLPDGWGSGFANVAPVVCLASGKAEDNQRAIDEILAIPSLFRTIRILPHVNLAELSGWNGPGFHVVADVPSELAELLSASTDATRNLCQEHGVPVFLNLVPSADYPKTSDAHLSMCVLPLPDTLGISLREHYRAGSSGSTIDKDGAVTHSGCESELVVEAELMDEPAVVAPDSLEDAETAEDRFVRLDHIVRNGLLASLAAGQALAEIRNGELWKAGGYSSWNLYCDDLLGHPRNMVNRLIRFYLTVKELGESDPPADGSGRPILPRCESVSRALNRLATPDERANGWRQVVLEAGDSPTAREVASVVARLLGAERGRRSPRETPRAALIRRLREVAEAADSWERVRELVGQLAELDHTDNINQ
ncbi:MAG: hypothetical protein J0M04_16005 [Verrucomicrobia bacterium]|nr:hypothetical protein [Verrucomicrobiota bacterium]